MRRFIRSVCVLCCASLCGCNEAAMIKKFAPQDEPLARKYLNLLLQRQLDQIQQDLDPSVADSDAGEKLQQVANSLPFESPRSVKLVNVAKVEGGGVTKVEFAYECEFENAWYVLDISLQNKNGTWTILGLHYNLLTDSLENLNRFTFRGKGTNQYAVLLLSISSLIVSLYALFVSIRTKQGTKRWLWGAFVLVGVGQLTVNWTTGELGLQILAVHLPPASATAAFYGPWCIGFSLPVGALMLLNEHWRTKVSGESGSDQASKLAIGTINRK